MKTKEEVFPFLAVFYHAMGYVSACWDNEFVCEALEKIDRPCPSIDI